MAIQALCEIEISSNFHSGLLQICRFEERACLEILDDENFSTLFYNSGLLVLNFPGNASTSCQSFQGILNPRSETMYHNSFYIDGKIVTYTGWAMKICDLYS